MSHGEHSISRFAPGFSAGVVCMCVEYVGSPEDTPSATSLPQGGFRTLLCLGLERPSCEKSQFLFIHGLLGKTVCAGIGIDWDW